MEKLQQIVADDAKGRYTLLEEQDSTTGNVYWMIRANQGHSVNVDDLELESITNADQVPMVVHGTKLEAWQKIKIEGLKAMKRNHIHFAIGLPDDGVKSGMRNSSQVLIYIDLKKALEDGLKFFKSTNNVILSSGINGVILPLYFSKVEDRSGNSLSI